VSDQPGWRARAERAAGGVQLAILRRGLCRAARLVPGVLAGPGPHIAYLARDGADTPLVCVHGFGGDKETWLLWAPWLPRRLPLLLVDLPGHGRSGAIDGSAAGARAQAEALLRLLDARGIDRAILVGNSMGGGVALRLARSWPDRVKALVLVASVGPDVVENQFLRDLRAGRNDLIPQGREGHEALARLALEKPPRVPRAIMSHVIATRAAAAPQLQTVWHGWLAAAGQDGIGVPTDVDVIAQPALLVHGARDRVVDVGTAKRLAARMPAAELVVLPGVGHAPQMEEPRRLARLVARFVAGRS
jgi:abhydrolase domain-containing protein 6